MSWLPRRTLNQRLSTWPLRVGLLVLACTSAFAQGKTGDAVGQPTTPATSAADGAPNPSSAPAPWQCHQASGSSPAEPACTQALKQLAVPDDFKSCSSWLDSAALNDPQALRADNFYSLAQALAHLRDAGLAVRWHSVAPGAFMLQLPCDQGAYNASSWFLAYDSRAAGAGQPAQVWPMAFPAAVGEPSAGFLVFSRWVGRAPDGLTVIGLAKQRGMGDAGLFTRHRINAHTLSPVLVQARQKTEADGRSAFGFSADQPLRTPTGAGWLQLAPPKPGTPAARLPLQIGMDVAEARRLVLRAGWRPKVAATSLASNWGTERTLREAGLRETQRCAMDRAICQLHYRQGKRCLSLTFEGEQVAHMRLQDWGRCAKDA